MMMTMIIFTNWKAPLAINPLVARSTRVLLVSSSDRNSCDSFSLCRILCPYTQSIITTTMVIMDSRDQEIAAEGNVRRLWLTWAGAAVPTNSNTLTYTPLRIVETSSIPNIIAAARRNHFRCWSKNVDWGFTLSNWEISRLAVCGLVITCWDQELLCKPFNCYQQCCYYWQGPCNWRSNCCENVQHWKPKSFDDKPKPNWREQC